MVWFKRVIGRSTLASDTFSSLGETQGPQPIVEAHEDERRPLETSADHPYTDISCTYSSDTLGNNRTAVVEGRRAIHESTTVAENSNEPLNEVHFQRINERPE